MSGKLAIFLAAVAVLLSVALVVQGQDQQSSSLWPFGHGFDFPHWPGTNSANSDGKKDASSQDGSAGAATTQNKQQQSHSPPVQSDANRRLYGPSLAVKPGIANNAYTQQGTTAPRYNPQPSGGTTTDGLPSISRGDAMNDGPAVVAPRDTGPRNYPGNSGVARSSPAIITANPSSSGSLAQDFQSSDATPRDPRSLQERLAAIRRSSDGDQPTLVATARKADSATSDATPDAAADSPQIDEGPAANSTSPNPTIASSPLSKPLAAKPIVVSAAPPAIPSATKSAPIFTPGSSSGVAAAQKPGFSSRRKIDRSNEDDDAVGQKSEPLAKSDAAQSAESNKPAAIDSSDHMQPAPETTADRASPFKADRADSLPSRIPASPFVASEPLASEHRSLEISKHQAKSSSDKSFAERNSEPKTLDADAPGNLDSRPAARDAKPDSKSLASKGPDSKSIETKGSLSGTVSTTRQSPLVSVETTGPRTIVIGKEATYLVTIKNTGDAGAQDLAVSVKIPEWTDVAGVQASTGATRTAAEPNEPFQWKIPRLEAHSKETLSLRLLPRKGRGFDLAVQWTFTPIASQTMVEVQEPKLNMTIAGPDEVIFGQSKLYRLTISNPGTGDAENVVVQLDPIGNSAAPASKHPIGTIHSGDSKVVELELTARQTGTIAIHAAATAEPGLKAEAGEDVLVRRAAVALGVEGPKSRYAGTLAAYAIHVSNPGNATAENIRITATLPQGAKFVSASAGGQWKADQNKVAWSLPSLRAAGETALELKCTLGTPGPNRLQVNSAALGDVSDVANTTTNVEALADLKLEVSEPAGPIAVGDEVSYELHIRNRGSKAADAVGVVIYFSEGLEPVAAEGNPSDISNGVVAFRPLGSVAAGGEAVLKVKAHADRSGKQVFRAEVECGALGTKLVNAQEMVVYGGDDVPGLERADRGIAGRNPPLQSVPNRFEDAPKPLRR